jgi:hypothetical protein
MRAAFDLSASSSWRETAETRERARDAENELALQREATRSLRTQLHAAEQQRRDDVKSLEKQISVLKTQVAEEAARADDRVRSVVSSESKKHADMQERHSRLRREHAALQAAVGRAGGGARGASELETSLTSERDDRFVKQLELVERNVRAEGRRAYEALERAKETQIEQLRSQSAKFLADANAELTATKADLERTKKHSERRVELLSSEVNELRSWASKMNGVLTKIEQGAYPVVERGFWRSLRVPPAEISFAKAVPNETPRDPLYGASEARTRSISRAVDNTSRFLETMEDDAMATSGVAEFRSTGSASDARSNSKSVSGSVPVAFGVSTSKSIDPYDTVPYDASTSNAKAGETFELEAFKRHGALVEEERAAVQEATLKELSSHPTVEYIRALEEENQKMKTDLSRERRSASDARVALQSARRQQEKHLAEKSAFSTRLNSRGGHTNAKPRASSARAHGARPTSAFGATVPKETFVGPPMSPESFRATMHDGRGQNAVIHTSSGLHASIKPQNKNAPLTSPEVVERVRVTTMSRDAARRASARRARAGVDDVATGASVGYLARQSSSLENNPKEDDLGYLRKLSSSRKNEPPDTAGSTSPRPPFGVAGGRRLTDTVPLAGRPLSGSAEVGYGFVLGDGPDAQGGAVGWPVGADRAKSLAERPETGPGGTRSGGAKRT